MKVIMERSSVCMGDDCLAPHARTYSLNDDATYLDLFECLKNDHYLPSISGNNVVWVLQNENYSCIFSYFTKTEKISMELPEKSLKYICQNSNKLKFEYYSSPKRWKEAINCKYNNDEYSILKQAWDEEIKYCDLLMEL